METRGGIAVETDVPGEAGPLTRVSYESRPGVVAVVAEFPFVPENDPGYFAWEQRLRQEIRNAKYLRERFLATRGKTERARSRVREVFDEEVGPEEGPEPPARG